MDTSKPRGLLLDQGASKHRLVVKSTGPASYRRRVCAPAGARPRYLCSPNSGELKT
jgi:hypothetical protein